MSEPTVITLSPDLSLPAIEFASQGNAILGIRDSGKSYTATWLAERLLDAGIPFVAFDPIGVWRHLKVAGTGPGYEVVVAGGETGDLSLTPQSAPEIVRAAMQANIPLVLDLYSMELSKADWKKIVEASVRLLLYENKGHGLRHIFLEEAAEFAPQRVGPDQGRVYAEIEKLARMGGNASLGYTLINQRAEEVNKAVLELCDCLFLHRQKGRHSLNALGKWMHAADATGAKEIVKSLPTLGQGDCWVWPQGNGQPTRIHVGQKRSFHPDRRHPETLAAEPRTARDVSGFVERLQKAIQSAAAVASKPAPSGVAARVLGAKVTAPLASSAPPTRLMPPASEFNDKDLRRIVTDISRLLIGLGAAVHGLKPLVEDLQRRLPPEPAAAAEPPVQPLPPPARPQASVRGEKLPRVALSALAVLAAHHPKARTKAQVALQAGYAVGGGGFGNGLSTLRTRGFITGSDSLAITPAGITAAGDVRPMPTGPQLVKFWSDQLPKAERAILEVLTQQQIEWPREALAVRAGYEPTGGGFGNALSRLRTLGLISGSREIIAADELF